VRPDGTVTAGNASGVNDGAAAIILASEEAVKKHGLTPRAKLLGHSSAGVAPRVMGIGPVPAVRKLLERLGLKIGDIDLIELNEAFASQGIAVLRQLGVKEDADFVNPHGGAIALGHPLGMSGAGSFSPLCMASKSAAASTRWRPCASASGRALQRLLKRSIDLICDF
jgi:3-oxoadipyl-CoA thiolase